MSTSRNSKNIIKLLVLGDFNTKKIIGFYKKDESDDKELFKKIESLFTYLKKFNNKNKMYHNDDTLFYTISKDNIFYAAAVSNSKVLSDNFDEKVIYEIFNEINNQSIFKFCDKNGELTNVGKQNLQYLIDKYEDAQNSLTKSKISQVNEDLGELTINMKSNIKNMMGNLNSVNELDDKAGKINDASLLFKNDSTQLRKNIQNRNMRIKLIMAVVIGSIIGFAVYKVLF